MTTVTILSEMKRNLNMLTLTRRIGECSGLAKKTVKPQEGQFRQTVVY